MNITTLVTAVMTLIAAIITTFLVPLIKSKLDAEQWTQLRSYVKIAVEAAEMIYTETGMGEKKKTYVLEYLGKLGFKLDTDTIDNLIESAVLELKNNN